MRLLKDAEGPGEKPVVPPQGAGATGAVKELTAAPAPTSAMKALMEEHHNSLNSKDFHAAEKLKEKIAMVKEAEKIAARLSRGGG